MKKKIIIPITIIILVIVSISIVLIYNNQINKHNNKIISLYKDLSNYTNAYNDIRKELSDKLNTFTYDNYKEEDYTDIFSKYNNFIQNIDKVILSLENICQNNKQDNKLCTEYQTIYEEIINIYISDINNYNKKTDKSIPLVHNEYIDYNNDDVFLGRPHN